MNTPDSPSNWDIGTLEKKWLSHLESMIADEKTSLPLKRLRVQAEQEPVYTDLMNRWAEMSAEERAKGWKSLTESVEKSTQELLPTCVQCGECCKNSSPTLHLEDLEIIREEKIPWDSLVTLRKGEPARNPHSGEPFFLPTDYIKIREKDGSRECTFYDPENEICTLYQDRPLQCRAQACWDSSQLDELIDEPRLARKDLFTNVKPLMQLMDEHDRRCSFENMRNMFETLKETEGKSIDAIIDLLAFDEHVRQFAGEKMNIPENVLDLVFGKCLSDRVGLFGFKIEIEADGTRTIKPV